MHTETAQSWYSPLRWSAGKYHNALRPGNCFLVSLQRSVLQFPSIPNVLFITPSETLTTSCRDGSEFHVSSLLFTGQFTIKAGESNSKGLKSTERIIIVQSEHIFCYTTKLHHNVVSWGEKKNSDPNNFTVKQKKPNPQQNQTQTKKPHVWQSQICVVGVFILSHHSGLEICSLE